MKRLVLSAILACAAAARGSSLFELYAESAAGAPNAKAWVLRGRGGPVSCLVSGGALAQQAAASDPSLDDFLTKFASDSRFRVDRIRYPLSVRIGNAAVVEVRVEKWERDRVRKELPPLLSHAELKEKGLDQRVRRASKTRVVVVQFRPEAQSTLRNYTFERVQGRWFLTRFEDASR